MAEKPKKQSNYSQATDEDKLKNYLTLVDRDLTNLFTYLDRFPRMFEQSAEPTLQRNTFGFWRDTDDGKIYLMIDISANTNKIEIT